MQHGLCTAEPAHVFLRSSPVACPATMLTRTWRSSKGSTSGTPPGPCTRTTSQNRATLAETWSRPVSKGETETRTQTLLICTTQFWPPHTNLILVLLLLPFREAPLTSTHWGSPKPTVTSTVCETRVLYLQMHQMGPNFSTAARSRNFFLGFPKSFNLLPLKSVILLFKVHIHEGRLK